MMRSRQDLPHQCDKPAAAGDLENCVKMLFHSRQTQAGGIGDLLIAATPTNQSGNFLFACGEPDQVLTSPSTRVQRRGRRTRKAKPMAMLILLR
jgi:hypothetical protein